MFADQVARAILLVWAEKKERWGREGAEGTGGGGVGGLFVVVFSSLARILGECSTIQSPPALFVFLSGD